MSNGSVKRMLQSPATWLLALSLPGLRKTQVDTWPLPVETQLKVEASADLRGEQSSDVFTGLLTRPTSDLKTRIDAGLKALAATGTVNRTRLLELTGTFADEYETKQIFNAVLDIWPHLSKTEQQQFDDSAILLLGRLSTALHNAKATMLFNRHADGKLLSQSELLTPRVGTLAELQECGDVSSPAVIYVNGAGTDLSYARKQVELATEVIQKPVVGVYNAHQGAFRDIFEAAQDRWSLGDHPSVATTRQLVNEALNAKQKICLIGQSQGAAIIAHALDGVRRELVQTHGEAEAERILSHVSVITLGGADRTFPKGPGYHHLVNQNDPIAVKLGVGKNGSPRREGLEASFDDFDFGSPVTVSLLALKKSFRETLKVHQPEIAYFHRLDCVVENMLSETVKTNE